MRSFLALRTTNGRADRASISMTPRAAGQNGNYLCELEAQPGRPEGRPDTTAGSKPISIIGLPQGVRPCSPCDPSQMRSFRNTLSQARLSISRSDPDPGVQRVALGPRMRLWFNHARYDSEGKMLSQQYPLGTTYSYTYDSMGRPTKMTDTGTSIDLVSTVTYGPAGEL